MEKYRGLFVSESEAHLEAMSAGVVALEAAPSSTSHINDVFRHLHSLKGMAATMGFDAFTEACHHLEDITVAVREGKRSVSRPLIEALLFAGDELSKFVAAIRDRAEPPALDALVARAQALLRSELPAPGQSPSGPVVAEPTPVIETGQLALRIVIDERSATPGLRGFLAAKRLTTALGAPLALSPSLGELRQGKLPGHVVTLSYSKLIDEQAVIEALVGLSDIARYEIVPVTQPAAAQQSKVERKSEARAVRVRTAVLDELLDAAGELLIAYSRVDAAVRPERETEVGRSLLALEQAVKQVHTRAMQLRTVPFSTIAERYPRVVRDVAAATGKHAELHIHGHELELDRAVLESVDAALVHLLRNAVDHGIEPAGKRGSKADVGSVVLHAERDRDTVAISVRDDGAGIDEDRLRQEAARRGVVLPVGPLSPVSVLRVLTSAGFSTKTSANHISGRGVGMDAVAEIVEGLGGSLSLEWLAGQWTKFTMRVPPSIAVLPVMRVVAGDAMFGVPLRRVVATEAVQRAARARIEFRGREVPLKSLGQLIGRPAVAEPWALLLDTPGGVAAMSVERVLDVRDAVVKKLGPPLSAMRVFDGATIAADGRPMMILDVPRLLGEH